MCKIKCPHFIHKGHDLQNEIVDKKHRKMHLLNFCCGNYKECKFYKEVK